MSKLRPILRDATDDCGADAGEDARFATNALGFSMCNPFVGTNASHAVTAHNNTVSVVERNFIMVTRSCLVAVVVEDMIYCC